MADDGTRLRLAIIGALVSAALTVGIGLGGFLYRVAIEDRLARIERDVAELKAARVTDAAATGRTNALVERAVEDIRAIGDALLRRRQ